MSWPAGRTRTGRLRRVLAVGTGPLLAAALLAGCGSSATGRVTGIAAAPPPPPLATSLSTPTATWVVVAMGRLRDPSNTFWQLFVLRRGARRWALATPPGVADNGGLVLEPTGPARLVVGFRPSQDLQFSPLAATSDAGRSYSPGAPVSGGLADVPDALAGRSAGPSVALTGTGAVVGHQSGAASWSQLVRGPTAVTGPAASGCRPLRFTAVAVAGTEGLVGAVCRRPGAVGIFQASPGRLVAVGPTLPRPLAGDRAEVLRLSATGGALSALIRLSAGGRTAYVSARNTGRGWSLGHPLDTTGALVSTGLTPDGFVLLTRTGTGRLSAAVAGPGGGWRVLPDPPPGTAAVAVSAGRVDAAVVGPTSFTDDRLAADGRWVRVQQSVVAIPYGSSS